MALNFELVVKRQAFLSSFSPLQVIQNSAPSTIVWRQCDAQMSIYGWQGWRPVVH